jgi:hypothetical protein
VANAALFIKKLVFFAKTFWNVYPAKGRHKNRFPPKFLFYSKKSPKTLIR